VTRSDTVFVGHGLIAFASAAAAFTPPAPTLDSSCRFVVIVLALGFVLGVTLVPFRRESINTNQPAAAGRRAGRSTFRRGRDAGGRRSIVGTPARVLAAYRRIVREGPFGVALTGLAAVTLALSACALTYVSASAIGF
jgi:hypothetical protein